MRTGTIAFLVGIVMAQQCSTLPASGWLMLLPLSVAALVYTRSWVRYGLLIATGFLWVLAYSQLFLHNQLPSEYEAKDVLIEGVVANIPRLTARSSRFDIDTRLGNKVYRFRLSWYEHNGTYPRGGERWRLRVKLKQPRGLANPGGNDYERSLYRQGISASGYVRRDDINEHILDRPVPWSLAGIRQHIADKLYEIIAESSHRGLIEALAIGSRNNISAAEWKILTRTGTIHLVAISGLHIGLVAGLFFVLIKFLVSSIHPLTRICPAQIPAAIGAITGALLYAALAGFSIPTVRALLMVCIVTLAFLFRRSVRAGDVITTSLLLFLIVDPLAVLEPGFWLSFGAVAVIIFSLHGRHKKPMALLGWGKIQLAIAIGMLPMMLIFFQRVSLSGPVANLLAVPWVSFITVPFTLAGTVVVEWLPWLAKLLLGIAGWSLDMIWYVLEQLDALPMSVIDTPAPASWTLLPAMMAVAWMLMPKGIPGRGLSVFLLLPAILITRQAPATAEASLTLLDVGQGQALLVRTRHHSLLYDAGPRYASGFDAGRSVVIPFLKSEGLLSLSMMIVGHGDRDHSGGADAILEQIPVRKIYTGANPGRWHNPAATRCLAGQSWQWDGVDFQIMHPVTELSIGGNNHSCVLRISIGQQAILIPGDIERSAEQELVQRYGDELQAQVMIAPHHGSKTSSSDVFLRQVSPEVVLVANGYRNRYGFPNIPVTERYKRAGIDWFETAKKGAISLKLTANGASRPVFWRDSNRRYWHAE